MALQIIVTPEEQALAINKYLAAEYGLNLAISSDSLSAVNITVKPMFAGDVTDAIQEAVTTEKVEGKEVEDDREWAETRAEELGISYRSDIKTSTLISRIEDEEERIMKEATKPDPLPMDEPEEQVYEEVEEVEEEVEEETEEVEEQPAKKSIFDL